MTLDLSEVKKIAVQHNGSNLSILGIHDIWALRQDDLHRAFQAIYAMGAAEQKEKDAKICETPINVDGTNIVSKRFAEAIRSQE